MSAEAGKLRYQFDQMMDGNLEPSANVHWLSIVIALRRQDNCFGAVFHIEKFSRRRSVPPAFYFGCAPLHSLNTFTNQRGNDMRGGCVEVIARTIQIDWQEIY